MIKILLKKQLSEIFKAYFFDMKKNTARTKASVVLYFALFTVLMVGVMGVMFGLLSFALSPIIMIGFGWLYFAIMSLISVLFGVFGSVFSTYSGLYLAKDNDLLLSMPIPVRAIMTSRLLGVYLMGLLYSADVIIPAVIVRFAVAPAGIGDIVGSILLIVIISLFVLALSCILGYLVARISVKLKNKSFVTVLISLLFFALYYFVYFKASAFIGEFVKNIAVYGQNIKDSAYIVYIIGRFAEDDIISILSVSAVVIAFLLLTLYVISRSFIKIATSTEVVKKNKYKGSGSRVRSAFGAVVSKELKHFTSKPSYMLNCGLGVVFMFAIGIFLLFKANDARAVLTGQFQGFEELVSVALCAAVCMCLSMNDTAAPSVSLEGKTLWQIRSLPVPTKSVLKAKYMLQIYIGIIPAVFLSAVAVIVFRPDLITGALIIVFSAVYTVFYALYSLYCGLHKVNLNWTNEIVPIKQGVGVILALFGGWGYAIAIIVPYIFLQKLIGAKLYLSAWLVIIILLSLFFYRWINKKGVKIFEAL